MTPYQTAALTEARNKARHALAELAAAYIVAQHGALPTQGTNIREFMALSPAVFGMLEQLEKTTDTVWRSIHKTGQPPKGW